MEHYFSPNFLQKEAVGNVVKKISFILLKVWSPENLLNFFLPIFIA